MGTMPRSANNVSGKFNGDNEKRDITDLWAEALSEYDGIVGFDLKPTFVNVESMIANGEKAMNDFHRFRHDQQKVDKLRSIFSANMSLIEKGAKQLVDAATPAFPPAAAIGTALTFVLSACKKVSADYDVVTAFFEDMNNFLQRVTILVKRSPQNAVWQKALLNVFTSFLKMCGFAHKYIEKGRFRKWVTNAVFGEDTDLAGSRKGMDAALSKLHAATEFATLGNTEELKQMNDELRENQEAQMQLSESQSKMLQTLLDQQSSLQEDMKKLMQYLEQQKKEDKGKSSKTTKAQNKATANRVKSVLPEVLGIEAEVQAIRKSFVSDTSQWIFEEEAWKTWSAIEPDSSSFLMIRGPPGIGKSHLAVSISDRLRKMAADEDGSHTTVTHFFCREANDDLKYTCWILVSLVLQISEHNLDLRERLENILAKESEDVDENDSWDLWTKLIVPLFGSDSKHRLFIVIDGLDELDDDDERTALLRCAKDIQKKGLKVKMVCTARVDIKPDFDVPGIVHIEVSKEKITPDLQRIVWNRMQNHTTDYPGLIRFSKYVKQRIASRLEEAADSLLYAEHMLRYLGRMSREAAVIKELEEAMPKDITDLFITMLSQSQRRTPAGLFGAIKSFLAWVSFCFRPLTLDEANQIVNADIRASTRRIGRIERFDLEEEIQITYSRFLQIGSSTSEVQEMFSPTTMMKGFSIEGMTDSKPVFDDGGLEIKFRERSMREFFSSAVEGEESLRMPSSAAHRTIFLACYRIVRTWAATADTERSSQSKSLYEYALQYCNQHWTSIDLTKHSIIENVEVAQAFASLFCDRALLATGLEILGENNVLREVTELFFDEWVKQLGDWRDWIKQDSTVQDRLNDRARKYWTIDIEDAAGPVARSHVENWFAAPDATAARKSYRFARGAIAITHLQNLLDDDFEDDEVDEADNQDQDDGAEENKSKEEILGLFNAFDIKKTSNAYFAVAVILNLRGNREEAAEKLEVAIEMCHDPAEQFRNYELLAYIYWELGRGQEAIYFVDLSLGSVDGITSGAIIKAYVTRARALAQQSRNQEAAESYRKGRLRDPEQVPTGRALQEESRTYLDEKDYAGLMSVLQEWRAIERLTFMTWNYVWIEWIEPTTISPLYVAAMECNKVDQLIGILEEVIQSLDIENAGAPLRNVLGHVHWRLRGDVQTAKAVLNIVLLNTTEGYGYALTDQAPSDAAWRAANMMTDILYQEFQASSDPSIKTSLYEEVKSLRQRPLLQSVQIISSDIVAYLLVLARMAQKIGPSQEFERVLKEAFNHCLEGLGDTTSVNDSVSTNHMARVLHMMDMHRDAEIFHSAQFYVLDSTAEDAEPAEGEAEDDNDQAANEADGEMPGDSSGEAEKGEDEKGEDEENGDDDDDDDDAEADTATPQTSHPESNSRHTGGIDDLTNQIDDMSLDNGNHKAEEVANGNGNVNTPDPATETGERDGEDIAYDLNEYAILGCSGVCMPDRVVWQSWDTEETGPMYQCLFCSECRLCQSCYEIRLRYNEEGKKENEPDFCCNNGQYLTGPIEGWKGIKEGVIYIEGEEPKEFKAYVSEVETRWKDRWTEFWRG